MRRPRTTQERRENGKRSQFARPKRSASNLTNAWDDKVVTQQRTWKKRRRSQYRVGGRGKEHRVLLEYHPSRLYWLKLWMEDHDVPCSIKYLYGNVCEFVWWTDKDVHMDRVLAQNNVKIAEQ